MIESTKRMCRSCDYLRLSWDDLGTLLGSSGEHLETFGAPWGAMEVALGQILSFDNIGRPTPSKRLSSTTPAHEKLPAGIIPRIPQSRGC